jgi:hypothetical protein
VQALQHELAATAETITKLLLSLSAHASSPDEGPSATAGHAATAHVPGALLLENEALLAELLERRARLQELLASRDERAAVSFFAHAGVADGAATSAALGAAIARLGLARGEAASAGKGAPPRAAPMCMLPMKRLPQHACLRAVCYTSMYTPSALLRLQECCKSLASPSDIFYHMAVRAIRCADLAGISSSQTLDPWTRR